MYYTFCIDIVTIAFNEINSQIYEKSQCEKWLCFDNTIKKDQ